MRFHHIISITRVFFYHFQRLSSQGQGKNSKIMINSRHFASLKSPIQMLHFYFCEKEFSLIPYLAG